MRGTLPAALPPRCGPRRYHSSGRPPWTASRPLHLWTTPARPGPCPAAFSRARFLRRRPPDLVGRVFRGSAAIARGQLTAPPVAQFRVAATVPGRLRVRFARHHARVAHPRRHPGPPAWRRGVRTHGAVLWGVDLGDPATSWSARSRPGPRRRDRRRALTRRVAGHRGGHRPARGRRSPPRCAPLSTWPHPAGRRGRGRVGSVPPPGWSSSSEVRAAARRADGPRLPPRAPGRALADGLAGSPQETRLRLLIHRSDLPAAGRQYRVRIDGRSVGRVDFAWPEHKLALGYEGVWHGERQQVARDRRRLNGLTRAGWRVIFVTAADLHDPMRLIARLAEELGTPRFA